MKIAIRIFLCYLLFITILLLLNSCAQAPPKEPLEMHWQFEDQGPGQPTLQCLPQEDVDKLVEKLVRCQNQ